MSFEFELDEKVQAIVEGRIVGRKDGVNRGNEYVIETTTASGRPIYRSFFETELDDPDEPHPVAAAEIIPLRAA